MDEKNATGCPVTLPKLKNPNIPRKKVVKQDETGGPTSSKKKENESANRRHLSLAWAASSNALNLFKIDISSILQEISRA